jgi:hypothetical protein
MTTWPDDLPVLAFADDAALEAWVCANTDAKGLWLKFAKKDSGIATVTYAEALDVALCHGWIDGQKRGFDDTYFLQRFTPRRPKGLWSKSLFTIFSEVRMPLRTWQARRAPPPSLVGLARGATPHAACTGAFPPGWPVQAGGLCCKSSPGHRPGCGLRRVRPPVRANASFEKIVNRL